MAPATFMNHPGPQGAQQTLPQQWAQPCPECSICKYRRTSWSSLIDHDFFQVEEPILSIWKVLSE